MKFNKYFLLPICLILASCGTTEIKPTINLEVPVAVGETTRVDYPLNESEDEAFFTCGMRNIPAYYEDGAYHAFISESYFSDMKPYSCMLTAGDRIIRDAIRVVPHTRDFTSEVLSVQPGKVKLSLADQKRVAKEQIRINKAYSESSPVPYFDEAFIRPLDSYITSHYGVKRMYNGVKRGQHLGTDFRARTPTPIPVANNGKVVLADNLFFTGNTVIVDHGVGVYTLYGHLSRIDVEVGNYVPQGHIIGLSGATGRVSGPHLHWGVKVNGNYIDGMSLIEATK